MLTFGLFGSIWLKGYGIWPGIFFPRIKSHSPRKIKPTHCLETLNICTIHQTMQGNCMGVIRFFKKSLLTYNVPTKKCVHHKGIAQLNLIN